MNFKHNTSDIKGISRLASAIASDDLRKVRHIMNECLRLLNLEKVYETILQSYLFCGFPAVIETLKIFGQLSGGFSKKEEKYDVHDFQQKGLKNCKAIYRNNFEKLVSNMEELSPDVRQWMIIEGYGKVMGRKGLNLLEREFVNVSILATRYYENQLHSHLKGCLFNGADKEEIEIILRDLEGVASRRNIGKAVRLLDSITGR